METESKDGDHRRHDMNAPAAKIIAKFGGNGAFSTAMKRRHSTTARWHSRGDIPLKEQRGVVLAARSLGIELVPEDFIDLTIFAE